jgi:ribonuclease BN (tRNA processing enzyme)
MHVVLLGSGGYIPTSKRHTACLLLPDIGVVLDAGTGMCQIGDLMQTEHLDVFLSHAHLDHVAGLTYLINVVPPEVVRNTTVRGEADKLAAVRDHLFAELIFPVAPSFRFEPLGGPFALPHGGALTHFKLKHPGGSIGFRLDWPGRSMAYVTDTVADTQAEYVKQVRGVDLLIHEAYFADEAGNLPAITGHSSLMAAVRVAASAGVGRLVLVHIDPRLEADAAFDMREARQVFNKCEVGFDGMELEF